MKDRIIGDGGKYNEPVLGRLDGYALNFNLAYYPKGTGFADIQPSEGSVLYGYTYYMDQKAFDLMDNYEYCFDKKIFPEGTLSSNNSSSYFRMKIKL